MMYKTIFQFVLLMSFSSSLFAKSFYVLEADEDFKAYPYVGAGLSHTFLNPEKEGTTLYRVSDDTDFGFYLRGGYRWEPSWSAEVNYFDLGEAGISSVVPGQNQGGGITYKAISVNANYYFGQDYLNWDAFAKIGLASLSNDKTRAFIPFEEERKAAIHTGLGDNWSVRVDLDLFSRDAEAISIGLQKAFIEKEEVVQEPIPKDSDGDGVFDNEDACPGTPPGAKVDELGCEIVEPVQKEVIEKAFAGLDFKGIGFEVASAKLTVRAMQVLDEAAQVLLDNPDVAIEIQAHTDSDGSEAFNKQLSQKRANSVKTYLESKGIPKENMDSVGYGELQPIADNSTPEGKAANRRVDIIVVEDESSVEDGSGEDSQEEKSVSG